MHCGTQIQREPIKLGKLGKLGELGKHIDVRHIILQTEGRRGEYGWEKERREGRITSRSLKASKEALLPRYIIIGCDFPSIDTLECMSGTCRE